MDHRRARRLGCSQQRRPTASLCSSVINFPVQTNRVEAARGDGESRCCEREASQVDWPNRNFAGTNSPYRTNNRFTVTVTVEIARQVNRNYDRSLYANHAAACPRSAINNVHVRINVADNDALPYLTLLSLLFKRRFSVDYCGTYKSRLPSCSFSG